MANAPVGVSAPWPAGTPIPGSDGDWTELTPGLDDGAELLPGWSDDPEMNEPTDRGETLAHAPEDEPWWHRLVLGALTVLILIGSAIGPASQPARAEIALGSFIQVGTGPRGVAVNPITNRIYVSNSVNASVSVIDGATNTVTGQPIL